MDINHLRLLAELADDLGRLDKNWQAWTLRRGQLYDPWSSAVTGFTPTDVRKIPILEQLVHALERERRDLRAEIQEREPRQLKTLSRPAQPIERREPDPRQPSTLSRTRQPERRLQIDRRSPGRPLAPFAFSAEVAARIALAPYEGQSRPPQDRSRK